MEILLATSNLHKIREFREMFRSLPHLELLSLRDFANYQAPQETGRTLKENAILKATHAAQHFKCWVLADDSGLFVPALQGKPGIYSKRYAGLNASDADNCKKLLYAMSDLQDMERAAFCECCLVLANQDGIKKCCEGMCEGYIAQTTKGRYGFGYDPLFIKHDYDKTFAELDETVKNRISHRHKAFERLRPYLEALKTQNSG